MEFLTDFASDNSNVVLTRDFFSPRDVSVWLNIEVTATNKCGTTSELYSINIPACDDSGGSPDDPIPLIAVGCNTIGVMFDAEQYSELSKIQIWHNENGPFITGENPFEANPDAIATIPYESIILDDISVTNKSMVFANLEGLSEETNYYLGYKTYDTELNESEIFGINKSIRTLQCLIPPFESTKIVLNENCDIIGLKLDWEYIDAGFFEIIEAVGQNTELTDETVSTIQISVQENENGYLYLANNEESNWIYTRWTSGEGVPTMWVEWSLRDSPCDSKTDGRSSSGGNYVDSRSSDPKNGAMLYPNPTQNEIFVKITPDLFQKYEIFDALGNSWYSGDIKNEIKEFKLDITKLPAGVYTIQLQSETRRWKSLKFVVSE